MKKLPSRTLAAALLAALLSSCHPASKLVYCPATSSVLDAVLMTQFRPGASPDPANVLYTVKINKVSSVCDYDKKGDHSSSDLNIKFLATRPNAGDAADYSVPYFVAITQADRIITKQERKVTVSFAAGQNAVLVEEPVDSVELTTDRDKKPYDYQIIVGMQLTKEQLDYNRKTGLYSQ